MNFNMTALLILPSFLGNYWGKEWRKNPSVTPPLGLLYVAGSLEKAGFKVRILDLNVEQMAYDTFRKLIKETDIVGISVLTNIKEIARALVEEIRKIDFSVKIICGGPYINSTSRPFPGADVTFVGEGDLIAGDVCRHLVRFEIEELKKISGLIIKYGNQFIKTGPAQVLKTLDHSLRPARHLIDPSRYGELIGIRLSHRITAISTSRGCKSKCAFCNRRGLFHYRNRDIREVVDEIEWIASNGYDLLVFNEDNFAVDPGHGIGIMNEIKRRNIKIRMMMQLRVDAVTEESIAAFKEAGVWCLIFGIESGSQEILDYYAKGTTVEQGGQALFYANRYGIFTFGFFILGAPLEREKHFQENLEFMLSVPLDFVGFNILDFEAGSRLWLEKVKEGVIQPHQIIVPTGPQFGALPYDELQKYLRWLYRKFYLRPVHLFRLFKKCCRARDFTLFLFMFKLSLKLFQRFRPFALAEELPLGVTTEDNQ